MIAVLITKTDFPFKKNLSALIKDGKSGKSFSNLLPSFNLNDFAFQS